MKQETKFSEKSTKLYNLTRKMQGKKPVDGNGRIIRSVEKRYVRCIAGFHESNDEFEDLL